MWWDAHDNSEEDTDIDNETPDERKSEEFLTELVVQRIVCVC